MQEGRTVKYAATCNAFGVNDKIPLSVIDENGAYRRIAYVRPLSCGYFYVEPGHPPDFPLALSGENRLGLYEDFPYFLFDLKPQGFLGRQIAKTICAYNPEFPPDPQKWNTNHIGRYLIFNGEDTPGNIILGEQLFSSPRQPPVPVSLSQYPQWAEKVLKGEHPGSSAGGEQPKFAVFNKESFSHVIVKFSSQGENEIAQRWKDILITEYYACDVLSKNGYPAPDLQLMEMEGRLFLQSRRFDRHGEFGRSSMLSLDVLDREFSGIGNDWARVVRELFNQGLVNRQDMEIVKELSCFGKLIHNSDMHLGNLSFAMEQDSFRLLPIYDMCSMGFAPQGGEILPFEFQCIKDFNEDLTTGQMDKVQKMAFDFWEALALDPRISNGFKNYLNQGNPVNGG